MPDKRHHGGKTLDLIAFSAAFRRGRCVLGRLASGGPVVYSWDMPFRLIARKLAALAVAYAIVLGGVLGAVAGRGFDPASQLCAPGASDAKAGQADSPPLPHDHEDCCQTLCGGAAAILSPDSAADSIAWFATDALTRTPALPQGNGVRLSHLARAPPAG